MTRSYVDKDEAVTLLRATSADVVYAIRNIQNPNAPAIGTWSASDVAAHLIDVAEAAEAIARGEGTPYATSADVTANNEKRLAERTDRDPYSLATQFEEAAEAYATTAESVEGDPMVPWADFEIPVSALVSVDLGEWLIHGYDITKSQGNPWGIDPHRAAFAGRGISPVTEHYVDPEAGAGFTATIDLRLRGHGALHFVFNDGDLSIEEPSDRKVDVHLSADPVAFMLVGYGRISQWGPMAKGKLLTWGRKPWVALKFASVLKNP